VKKRIVWILAAAAAGALLMGFMTQGRNAAPPSEPSAAREAGSTVICAAGKVQPISEEIKIASQLEGVLRDVLVEEGQRVRRGQPIAILDNADYTARVAEARATVEIRQSELDRVINGARDHERREALASVEEAKAVLAEARSEMQRRQSLFQTGDISRSDWERAQREYEVAQARVGQASHHYAFLDAPARADERARAEANLALSRAQLAEAEALLAKTIIRAPFDGAVLKRFRRAGEVVTDKADSPIISFGDVSRLCVRVDVDETDVARPKVGDRAYFTAQAFGDQKFWGRVVRVGRLLGRKNVETNEPAEKIDTKILETLVELDGHPPLPAGLRVDSFISAASIRSGPKRCVLGFFGPDRFDLCLDRRSQSSMVDPALVAFGTQHASNWRRSCDGRLRNWYLAARHYGLIGTPPHREKVPVQSRHRIGAVTENCVDRSVTPHPQLQHFVSLGS
jgi:HlyD family secretion protein